MKVKKIFLKAATIALLLGNCAFISAQVTIGADKAPQSFSLLELVSDTHNGLRLPQIADTNTRNAISDAYGTDPEMKGLQIFNMETKCVETWNGSAWISMCADCSKTVFAAINSSYTICGNNATADALTAAVGSNVQWYGVPDGGTPLAGNATLTSGTYYAEQKAGSCTSDVRTPVAVTVADCTSAPVGAVTAFVNVMYDFQYQTIEAYKTSGGDATGWQWELSPDNSNWTPIAGATSATYRIPENFIQNYSNYNAAPLVNDTVYFRCLLSNPANPAGNYTASNLGIEFIRTNTAGYGIDPATGVRYLTINRGDANGIYGNTIKIALLSLGQSGTGSLNPDPLFDDSRNLNDAADLGDFYQWGRVPDGHQQTVWSKDPSTSADSISPMTGSGATSLPVYRGASAPAVDGNGQVTDPNLVGNFITVNGTSFYDWGQASGNSDLWGNGVNSRAGSPVSLDGWTSKAQANNPCPTGWRIPSRFEFSDIYNDDGTGTSGTSGGYGTVASGNTWRRRNSNSPSGTQAIGGVIITNSSGEKVFLPAPGFRYNIDGSLRGVGTTGYYWSSTYLDPTSAYYLGFDSNVNAGTSYPSRAAGMSVRCVKE